MTTALPVVAGIVLQLSSLIPTLLTQHPGLITFFRTRTLPSYFLSNVLSFMALLVYETVLATLAGTHIAPREALHCALEEKPVQSQRFASNHQDSGRFPVLWPQK